jgi:dipeptidyl aminopeptidase/acylaminoacyl peptidase
MSPDGRYLAYTKSNKVATSQVYVLNLETNENILLHQFQSHSFTGAFDWSADSQKVILIEADKLLRIDIATKDKGITIFSGAYQAPYDLAVLQEKDIFVVPKVESQLALVKVDNLFNENIPIFKAIQQSDKQSYEPIVDSANIQNIFFASNRLGGHQIWAFNQGSLKQLSFMKNSTARLSSLKLSVDSKMLLFTQNSQVHLLNLSNNTVSVIAEIPNNVDSYAWSINNSIIFSGEEDKIWELNIENNQRQLIANHGGDALIGDGRGNVHYFKNDYLVGFDGVSKQKLPISSVNIRSSVLTKNYLYVNNQTTLYRIDRTTDEVKQSELSFLVESFSVLPNDRAVILTQTLRNDSQVKRITWL